MKIGLVILCAFCLVATVPAHGQTNPPMKLVQAIPLPNVEGYFDHMAVDIKGQRLFVPGEHSAATHARRSICWKQIRSG